MALFAKRQAVLCQGRRWQRTKDVLARCGGNSFRAWGIGPSTQEELDQAERLGLTVSPATGSGTEQGFSYDDAAAVKRQFDEVQRAV